MTRAQLEEYDRLLDENDWDLYYWATQDEPDASASSTTTTTTATTTPSPSQQGSKNPPPPPPSPAKGEWAQTVGAFRPAHRPVPARWRDSEILAMLRAHVAARRAGGRSGDPKAGCGLGFMPPLP